jgi:hypothetical protein
MGARAATPRRRHEAPVTCADWIYDNHDLAERSWAGLEGWRAIATRDEKATSSFVGVQGLAAALDWLKNQQALVDAAHAQSIPPASVGFSTRVIPRT